MTIEYRLGRLNTTTNALNRMAQIVVLEEDELPTLGGSRIHVLKDLHEKIIRVRAQSHSEEHHEAGE